MAPVAPWISLLLAAGLVADVSAKPLFPGRHAPPTVANLLSSHVKKDLHSRLAEKYAEEERGLVSFYGSIADVDPPSQDDRTPATRS